METVEEDVEEYSWRDVMLPRMIPVAQQPELDREPAGERRRGRDILIAIDHGPNSRHAFHWALAHFCRLADTIHLLHAVSSVHNEVVYEKSRELMERLAVEAMRTVMVKTVARIVEGDPGKVICREADRLKPAAIVMGTRGRGIIQRNSRVELLHKCPYDQSLTCSAWQRRSVLSPQLQVRTGDHRPWQRRRRGIDDLNQNRTPDA